MGVGAKKLSLSTFLLSSAVGPKSNLMMFLSAELPSATSRHHQFILHLARGLCQGDSDSQIPQP